MRKAIRASVSLAAALLTAALFAAPAFAATILTTASSDSLNTFRTNVNTSLTNLNTDKIGTTSSGLAGQLPYWTGTNTVGSVATGTVSAGTGISVTGSRSVLGGGLTITNTSPDQTVSL